MELRRSLLLSHKHSLLEQFEEHVRVASSSPAVATGAGGSGGGEGLAAALHAAVVLLFLAQHRAALCVPGRLVPPLLQLVTHPPTDSTSVLVAEEDIALLNGLLGIVIYIAHYTRTVVLYGVCYLL